MGISSSMNAGVSGLSANASKLATISDNIANAQTAGYKRAGVDFASLAVGQNARTYNAGGVTTTTVRNVEAKGGFIGTGNATDIAIAGRGMLPVTAIAQVQAGNPNYPLMLTPTGSFQPDANGVLRTPSGLVLLGWPADAGGTVAEPPRDTPAALQPVTINRAAVAAQPTGTVTLNANLPASATNPDASLDASYPITVEYFDNLGASKTLAFDFRPVSDGGAPARPVPNLWTMTITDSATGAELGAFELAFSDAAGSAGRVQTVTQTSAGPQLYDPATGEIALALGGGQTIAVRLGAAGGEAPQYLSQLASVFSPLGVSKDGAPAGSYAGLSIDENGYLSVNYTSGFSQVIYKIPVADVPNLNGLEALSNQAFAVTRASGAVYFWDAGSGPTGAIMGYTQEQSTTDIAEELTQLIQTQRAYSSNAKIIQTVDEMLQETTNLKR